MFSHSRTPNDVIRSTPPRSKTTVPFSSRPIESPLKFSLSLPLKETRSSSPFFSVVTFAETAAPLGAAPPDITDRITSWRRRGCDDGRVDCDGDGVWAGFEGTGIVRRSKTGSTLSTGVSDSLKTVSVMLSLPSPATPDPNSASE